MGDSNEMAAAFEEVLRSGDFTMVTELAQQHSSDDFVQEWPQSGERMNKDNAQKLAESYSASTGTSPTFSYRRMLAGGDVIVIEGSIDYGDGVPVSYVGIGELRDGKITKMTEYFANPFEAPAWRADMVEKMEPVDAGGDPVLPLT